LERIPCYKPLYDNALFKTVRFKNKRIYWSEQFDFHLDQILECGHFLKVDETERAKRGSPDETPWNSGLSKPLLPRIPQAPFGLFAFISLG
jgi:hypothetical protein